MSEKDKQNPYNNNKKNPYNNNKEEFIGLV